MLKAFGNVLLLLFCMAPPAYADIGYFSPSGVREDFASHVDMATINASDGPNHIAESFQIAAREGLKINLDIGPLISGPRMRNDLNLGYNATSGDRKHKKFPAHTNNKLRDFYADDEIRNLLHDYLTAIQPYKDALYAVFLVDEPYLNGVSRQELERVAILVRQILAEHGMKDVKMGVLFAGAMFNADFASAAQRSALNYAEDIDRYLSSEATRLATLKGPDAAAAHAEFEKWKDAITGFRLTTYDSAGNLYEGGGIPAGFDIVAFDFYASTVLLDGLYEEAIAWLAINTQTPHCDGYERVRMSRFRAGLSFFQDGPMTAGDALRESDDSKLTKLFNCRVGAVVELLQREIESSSAGDVEIMAVSESSSNGFLEFSSSAAPEQGQPELLVKERVVKEVQRALDFYRSENNGIDHLLFFTFDDEFDDTIQLPVGGVASIPDAMDRISEAASRHALVSASEP